MRRTVASLSKKQSINLTPEESAILVNVHELGSMRIGDLAEALLRDATTLTRQVAGLEKKGLLRRRTSRVDRRSVKVTITDAGKLQIAQMQPMLSEFRDNALNGFTEEEVAQLISFKKRILKNLGAS